MEKIILLILHLEHLEIEVKDLVKDLEQDNQPEMKPTEDQDKILTSDKIHSRTRNSGHQRVNFCPRNLKLF